MVICKNDNLFLLSLNGIIQLCSFSGTRVRILVWIGLLRSAILLSFGGRPTSDAIRLLSVCYCYVEMIKLFIIVV